jgi:crotonobetainyl-CoA:carnitine CoA-transferase CaiB-like acyl-CoA transferase
MKGTPAGPPAAPPLLGQHTRAILKDSGYTGDEIEDLLTQGLVVETNAPEKAVL